VEHAASRTNNLPAQPSIPRRALRKAYRTLNQIKPLQPAIEKIRIKLLERLDRKNSLPEPETLTAIQRSFTIAFTMRSGSNEICNMLARNGLGTPSEFFPKPLSGGSGLVLDGFSRIVSRYQVRGIFGSKMAQEHRAALDEQLRNAIPGYTRIDDVLPNHKWVWLVRRDKILQAISWCRAEASNEWASGSSADRSKRDVEYDFVHILSRLMMIYASEVAWENYFSENGIEPLKIVYEDFFRDLDQQLRRLIDYLGGLPSTQTALDKSTTFDVQRNEKSFQARQHFVSDLVRQGSNELTVELGAPYQKWAQFLFEFGWRI
jgi:LPS sulfotransferase NodH